MELLRISLKTVESTPLVSTLEMKGRRGLHTDSIGKCNWTDKNETIKFRRTLKHNIFRTETDKND
jgi:hypothetical protein